VAPTTNSYKRLASQDPPVKVGYSREDRSAVCRVLFDPDGLRIEFRAPDPSANPYLAFAAMLMAGLDGVLNRIDPGEPLESSRDDASRPQMPVSLDDALDCLDDDHDFLIKSDVFSEDTLETFIEYKRRHESEPLRARPHPHEFELYYDV
jgi:glutamine synthetase